MLTAVLHNFREFIISWYIINIWIFFSVTQNYIALEYIKFLIYVATLFIRLFCSKLSSIPNFFLCTWLLTRTLLKSNLLIFYFLYYIMSNKSVSSLLNNIFNNIKTKVNLIRHAISKRQAWKSITLDNIGDLDIL